MELNIFGDLVRIRLRGRDTEGLYSIFENSNEPQAGPPLHRHGREDEWFYVIEGQYRFEVDGQRIQAGPGDSLLAPCGSVHTFRNVGATPGRLLVVVQPAGLDNFFTELAAATAGMAEPDPSVMAPIFHKYGLELLGPPMAASKGDLSMAPVVH